MTNLATNPGSYGDFTAQHGLESGPDAIVLHSEALRAHREGLAEAHGMSVEDLHTAQVTALGEFVTKSSIAV